MSPDNPTRPKSGPIPAAVVCEGKHPFPTRGMAVEVAGRSNRRRKKGLVAYRCPVCLHWHLGGNKNRAVAKRRRDLRIRREAE